MTIHDDVAFKSTLATLSVARQRQIAARFVQQVQPLSGDARIQSALDTAGRAGVTAAELEMAAQAANSARVESFTRCGRETDWRAQAGHFVARAAVACVKPEEKGDNLAWDAAMQARLARTCETVAEGTGTDNREAEAQYRILDAFLNS
jgi:hypothetical protein